MLLLVVPSGVLIRLDFSPQPGVCEDSFFRVKGGKSTIKNELVLSTKMDNFPPSAFDQEDRCFSTFSVRF